MMPNQTLSGRYKIIRSLGEGGMASVYLAHDLILDRDVAVKLVRLDMQDDEAMLRRFQREVLATTELTHKNIVGVYDVGEDHGNSYLVMEYVEGENLKKYIKDHFPIPYPKVVLIMRQILQGVQAAHQHGIIHRDLKPQNIMMDKAGNAKITDFGIAMANEDSSFTRTNAVIGSVQYLSPEQVKGHVATRQSDIYSLGIILFELLTGEVPFQGESAVSIAVKHYQDQLPLVRDVDPNIPQSLENVVLKATAKNQFDRYVDVGEMLIDLETVLDPKRKSESKYVAESASGATIVLNQDEIQNSLNSQAPIDRTIVRPVKNNNHYKDQQPISEAAQQHRPKHRHPIRRRALFLALITISFITGIALALQFTMPQSVEVPNLSGLTRESATTELSKRHLGIGNVTYKSNRHVSYDHVINSLPDKGQKVQKGVKVNIALSQGPDSFDVDNYIGSDYASTKQQLEAKGFKIKKRVVSTNQFDADRIVSQDIAGGRTVKPRSTTITFTVAK